MDKERKTKEIIIGGKERKKRIDSIGLPESPFKIMMDNLIKKFKNDNDINKLKNIK